MDYRINKLINRLLKLTTIPNWVNNSLFVDGSANPKQLKKFIDFVSVKSKILILKKDLNKKRKLSLKKRSKEYKDKIDVFIEHSKMEAIRYFCDVLNMEADKYGNIISKYEALSFEKALPCPKELVDNMFGNEYSTDKTISEEQHKKNKEKLLIKYGADSQYDWNINNYGTKWDVNAEITDETETSISYQFDSAWSAPCEFFRHIALKFKDLEFNLTFEEPGCGFEGEFSIRGDEVLTDETRDYISRCDVCGEKDENAEYDDETGETTCLDCKEPEIINNEAQKM